MLATRLLLVLVVVLVAVPRAWAGDQFILTAPESEAFKIVERHGLRLLDLVPEREVFLVEGPDGVPPDQVIARILADPELDDEQDNVFVELNVVVSLPEAGLTRSLHTSTADAERTLLNRRTVTYYGNRVWASHARQRATTRIRLADAHAFYGTGSGVVAVIDSGVDPSHPALAGSLVGGYDFTIDQPTASEVGDVPSDHPILNPTNVLILDNDAIVPFSFSAQALLEPGQAAAIAPGTVPVTFGHGTMVASIVRLVAPGALVMPLRAFGADGTGRLFNVVRALYYAQVHGATVVNLSLSMAQPSVALTDAVRYLHEKQMFCVAAVGNDGQPALRYPAALPETFGVASVNAGDRRSSFTNYGDQLVKLAAPGEAVVAAFPGSQYALGWGTSFATPFAAGSIALMQGIKSGINWDEVLRAFEQADPVAGAGLGAGRLNVLRALDDVAGVTR
jgi:subtilisin family serine protease